MQLYRRPSPTPRCAHYTRRDKECVTLELEVGEAVGHNQWDGLAKRYESQLALFCPLAPASIPHTSFPSTMDTWCSAIATVYR